MSIKMAVYYAKPEDPEGFEKAYVANHIPLTEQYPGIKHTSFHKVGSQLIGEFEYSYVFTGTWDDMDSWKAAMGSPENDKVVADAKTYGVEMTAVLYEQLA